MTFNILRGGADLRIGVDLDGIITRIGFYNPSMRLPWWLFYMLAPIVSWLKPDKTVIKKLQAMEDQGCKILIVTARPHQSAQLTEQWLERHHIPFDKLFCVGFGKGTKERKLKIVRDEKMEIFIDSNSRIVEFMKRNSVHAVNGFEHFN